MEEPLIPLDAIESSTAHFWMDDGIIFILNKKKMLHGVDEAVENIIITHQMGNGKPYPLLIDMTNIKSISRAAREKYAEAGNGINVSAVALITGTQFSRMIGNFFIGFNTPLVPTRLFSNHTSAKKWLSEYKKH